MRALVKRQVADAEDEVACVSRLASLPVFFAS